MDRGSQAVLDVGTDGRALRLFGLQTMGVPQRGALPSALTTREREVLELLRDRLTDAEIATVLCISRRTASHHVGQILVKLGVANRREAGRMAILIG